MKDRARKGKTERVRKRNPQKRPPWFMKGVVEAGQKFAAGHRAIKLTFEILAIWLICVNPTAVDQVPVRKSVTDLVALTTRL